MPGLAIVISCGHVAPNILCPMRRAEYEYVTLAHRWGYAGAGMSTST